MESRLIAILQSIVLVVGVSVGFLGEAAPPGAEAVGAEIRQLNEDLKRRAVN